MSSSVCSLEPIQTDPNPLRRDGLMFLAPLTLFLLAHFFLRLLASPSLYCDDADLILFHQSFAWGYSEQPPLYSWLFWFVALPFGANVFSLTLMRTLILGAMCSGIYLSVHTIWEDKRLARLAAFSLLLIPVLAWHALTYLTHSILMTTLCVFTFYFAVRIVKGKGNWNYLWLGICIGLGMLSKYNYLFFVVALMLAGLTVPEIRCRLLHWRMGASLLLAGLMFMPHALWMSRHFPVLQLTYADKTTSTGEHLLWGSIPRGPFELIVNMSLLSLPMILVFLFLFPKAFEKRSGYSEERPFERWLVRYFVALGGIHLLYTLATQSNRFHERWLEPFFVLLPVLLLGRLAGTSFPKFRFALLGWLLIVFAIGFTLGRYGQVWFGGGHRGYNAIDYDFRQAVPIVQDSFPEQGLLVADSRGVGGNLLQEIPGLRCVCLTHLVYQAHDPYKSQGYMFVWDTEFSPAMPANMLSFAEDRLKLRGIRTSRVHYFEVDSFFPGRDPRRFGYLVVPSKN